MGKRNEWKALCGTISLVHGRGCEPYLHVVASRPMSGPVWTRDLRQLRRIYAAIGKALELYDKEVSRG